MRLVFGGRDIALQAGFRHPRERAALPKPGTAVALSRVVHAYDAKVAPHPAPWTIAPS
jgi:hypothetical protein